MNINEIYKELKTNDLGLEFKECDVVEFTCPHCQKHLFSCNLTNKKLMYKLSQRVLYDDGDTLYNIRGDHSKVSSSMMFGVCKKCGQNIANIELDLLGKDVGLFYVTHKNDPCLLIVDPDNLIKNFDSIKLFDITIKNKNIGYMVHYKNVDLCFLQELFTKSCK